MFIVMAINFFALRKCAGTPIAEIEKMSITSHVDLQNSRSAIGTYFDYVDAKALRQMALTRGVALPRYLLAPEVALLLGYLPDLRQRLLIETMWNTGARLNEALALTPASFELSNPSRPFVVLRTLKLRKTVSTRNKGRPTKYEVEELNEMQDKFNRIVPLLDDTYVRRLKEYLMTFKPAKYKPLWQVKSDETPRNWLKAALERARRDGVTFSFSQITPKTFRHSFAMHLIQNHVPLKVVQSYMGHQELSSTEVYTKIFALDVGHHYGVRFSIPQDEAIRLLGP